jgi:glycosyltransferase involved in cell wall biosynthesis
VNSSLPEAAVLDASFVSPTEPDELASAMARILRNQTASKNQTAFNANMTWDDTLANWICAAKQVLETRKNDKRFRPTSRPLKLNARRNTLTVQLDCHNITINRSKLHKTGIQEVSARLFAAIPEANKELGHLVRFEPLPVCIPHYKIRGTVPTLTPSVHHWQELCEELRIDLNSLGANFRQILSGDSVALASTLQHSDWLFLTSQVTSKLIPGLPNARAAGLKLGYLVHDIIPSVLPQFAPPHLISWFNEAYVESLKEADLIVGNSRHTALDVAQHLGDLNSTYVHWTRFPTHQSLSETGLPSEPPPADLRDKPYFVLLGSTDPRKNVFNALKAMERFILDDSLQTKPILVMVGASGWNNDGLNALLNTLERQALVKRMGYVSDAKLANLLAHCKALLMPSRYEGFGMPIAQANAQGIPVLTCNNSSLPEVALDGSPSFVYPEHADELYFAMRRVMMTESKKEVGEKETSWVELLVRIGHILEQHSN